MKIIKVYTRLKDRRPYNPGPTCRWDRDKERQKHPPPPKGRDHPPRPLIPMFQAQGHPAPRNRMISRQPPGTKPGQDQDQHPDPTPAPGPGLGTHTRPRTRTRTRTRTRIPHPPQDQDQDPDPSPSQQQDF
ncbi:hypothetical protein GEV33_001428 [Tenebrio molitor]|uniref:Uncharacterized protein n=1 Tax=Tenebrio molitor TaxID=7067 RepID=A0A8J6LJW7_TENMO|nr:hypothetical protein GEV33_001428 [Tenebrio molitor]